MKVKVISVLEDNYMYLVIEESSRDAVAVDAAVPRRLLEIARREDVALRAVLTTHHHWDHARGNGELAELCPGLRVYGADERIGALTHKVAHGEELAFGAIRVRCLLTPGHTSGHVCYFMWEDESPDAPALFSGTAGRRGAARSPRFAFGRPRGSARLRPRIPQRGRALCPRRRHAVGGRLREALRGHGRADVRRPDRRPGRPAQGDEGVLRPRVHRAQPQVRLESGAGERSGEEETRLGQAPGRRGPAHGALHAAGGVPLQPLPAGRGGALAEVHGQDGPGGGAEDPPRREGSLQEAQGAAQPAGPARAGVGAPEPLPGEEVTRRSRAAPDPGRLPAMPTGPGSLWQQLRPEQDEGAEAKVMHERNAVSPITVGLGGCSVFLSIGQNKTLGQDLHRGR